MISINFRYRDALKSRPQDYYNFKEHDRIRKKVERAQWTEEQRERQRQKNRERQKRFRERHRHEDCPTVKKKTRVLTRNERDKKRTYWRQKQQECRNRKSNQKLRWKREKDKKYRKLRRASTKTTCDSLQKEKTEQKYSIMSKAALRKAAQRAKVRLPTNAAKFAETITYVVSKATPQKNKH